MATVVEATARHAGRGGHLVEDLAIDSCGMQQDGEDDAQAAIPYLHFKAKGFSPPWNPPRYAFA